MHFWLDELVSLDTEISTRNVAVVKLDVNINGQSFTVVGDSKRDPLDKHDEETGLLLAYARAFKKISNRLEKQAAGRVKSADDARAVKAKTLAEKASVTKKTRATKNG